MRTLLTLLVLAVNILSAFEAHTVDKLFDKARKPLTYAPVEEIENLNAQHVAETLRYYVYTRKYPERGQIVQPDVESVIRNVYNPLKPTTFVLHRWQGHRDVPENIAIIEAKLEQQDGNVIVVDWGDIAKENLEPVDIVPAVAEAVADFAVLLHKFFDVDLQQMHLVGFSLGAHIAGVAGEKIYQKTAQKVPHITGLDPADPTTYAIRAQDSLSADAALFVDVIHTNAGGFGYSESCGHADYYPNGGEVQPDCSAANPSCSHERAYELVKEMWSRENEFVSAKCANAAALSLKQCTWVNVKMGENLQRIGLYYLETNGEYPYAKGSYVYTFL